jgi:hypothetical protein
VIPGAPFDAPDSAMARDVPRCNRRDYSRKRTPIRSIDGFPSEALGNFEEEEWGKFLVEPEGRGTEITEIAEITDLRNEATKQTK